MPKKSETPVYMRLVEKLQLGIKALDTDVQEEIKTFIKTQQHKNGAFIDRSGQPAVYYSLFGLWLSMATEQKELQNNLLKFIPLEPKSEFKSPVEELALLLIKSVLIPEFPKQSVSSIIRTIWKKSRTSELSYQFFLLALAIDAVGKNKPLFYFFARIWLHFYNPKGNIPCSVSAALIYTLKILGLKTQKKVEILMNYLIKTGGFKAFETTKNADSLSTGVALFVLNEIKYDLRMIAPGCLDFIQSNYSEGAFLSGDEDMTRDLEYTFYGLLALGSLVNPGN